MTGALTRVFGAPKDLPAPNVFGVEEGVWTLRVERWNSRLMEDREDCGPGGQMCFEGGSVKVEAFASQHGKRLHISPATISFDLHTFHFSALPRFSAAPLRSHPLTFSNTPPATLTSVLTPQ